jgi:1,4-dihydroxy-2-naphthoate octaprenyltransferase
VRMGLPRAARAYGYIMLVPFVPIVAGAAGGLLPKTTLIGLGAVPFALRAIAVARKNYASPKALAPANALTIVTHTLTGALMTLGYLIAR